ncbi:MAG TPA: HAMP domain-containing sensor histidine kinase [Rhizomicrobium sp.]|nr:HAMP domain-containing sensor histidine kinase [Rhizomicrobium sp.]
MAQAQAAHGRVKARATPGVLGKLTRNVRAIAVLSVILIAGSFAAAAAIQMRLDRSRALDQAAYLESRRAAEIATDFAGILDRYVALGGAFANSTGTAETSAALSEVGGKGLLNIAVLSKDGRPLYEMKSDPSSFLPLPETAWAEALARRTIVPSRDGRTTVIAFPTGDRVVAMQLDPRALVAPASMEETVFATRNGELLALGSGWKDIPPMAALATGAPDARVIDLPDEHRLVALSPVPGWAASVGASVESDAALGAWYGALPLYFFLIFGPSLAGAGLAVVFVREFEKRAKTAEAVKNLKAVKPEDAKLRIRLAEAERRAFESQRAKAEFIGHMSHELRTPLNAIIGFSEVIERGVFGPTGHPKYVEYARDINAAGRSLHDKIGDILDFADLEAGRQSLAIDIIDIAAIARDAIGAVAARARLRSIRLTVALPERTLALGDARAAKRILSNLLTNALQYTPESGAVRIQVRTEKDAVVFAVRDTGFGFTPPEMNKAGAAFARFDRPGTAGGNGLGLAMCAALAERMHGVVQIQSRPGEGTLAQLRLPKA